MSGQKAQAVRQSWTNSYFYHTSFEEETLGEMLERVPHLSVVNFRSADSFYVPQLPRIL